GPVVRAPPGADQGRIAEPVVRLVRAEDGRLNFDFLRERAKAVRKEKKHASEPPEDRKIGPPFQLAALALRDGTISFAEQATHRTLVLRDVAVDAEQPDLG